MNHLTSIIKKDLFGYIALTVLIATVLYAHLLLLCLFFLFIYLMTDFIAVDLHRHVPRIPAAALFWSFYAILIAAATLIIARVMPLFFEDFSKYYSFIQEDSLRFINFLSVRFGIAINPGFIKDTVFKEGAQSIGKVLEIFSGISHGVLFFIFAIVLNALLFHEKDKIEAAFTREPTSLLAYLFVFVVKRIATFYGYFRKVMGGQVLISLVNSIITLIALIALGFPHKTSLVCIVFLCGLLPIIGNLISNTILAITALVSIGIPAFIICLGLLLVIHKLEYFLNGKIIGSIVSLPMFLTLLSLLIGEALLGIPGMIIAIPLVLTIRDELESAILTPAD
jgi:predicted PurR-regulated permease PerM